MSTPFTVLIPARMASSRLPDKPLADLGGQAMVVRVAERALQSKAQRVVVAADDERIAQACRTAQIECVLTARDHPSGSDRLAQACDLLALVDDEVVVNVQGDEPFIEPDLINKVAQALLSHIEDRSCVMSTAAHPIESPAEIQNPNVVKVVTDQRERALYFSRAPIPWWRDGWSGTDRNHWQSHATHPVLRHIGIYAYRVQFLREFPKLSQAPIEQLESLEQLRALWHGYAIAVHQCAAAPLAGVDTPEDLERARAHWAQRERSR